jgi:hypothetical protein
MPRHVRHRGKYSRIAHAPRGDLLAHHALPFARERILARLTGIYRLRYHRLRI